MTIALGGSCEEFAGLDWRVEGREIIIDVTTITKVPTAPVPCTLAIIYEDQSVNIGDKYETGAEYDVIVNGERHGTFIGAPTATPVPPTATPVPPTATPIIAR